MSKITFKALEASDVEARVAQCSEKGCSLLLYKDARCDMRILDETVGAENWDCRYREVKGNLFCEVGIFTEDRGWVRKQDVGIPSNMEAEKGEASDAFKRACFKWGIGRELYTAPFIWVPRESLKTLKKNDRGKWACYDRFSVDSMRVEDGAIVEVSIRNDKTGKVVWPTPKEAQAERRPDPAELRKRTIARLGELSAKADQLGFPEDYVEVTAVATYGREVGQLEQPELNELGKAVAKAIADVESGG